MFQSVYILVIIIIYLYLNKNLNMRIKSIQFGYTFWKWRLICILFSCICIKNDKIENTTYVLWINLSFDRWVGFNLNDHIIILVLFNYNYNKNYIYIYIFSKKLCMERVVRYFSLQIWDLREIESVRSSTEISLKRN